MDASVSRRKVLALSAAGALAAAHPSCSGRHKSSSHHESSSPPQTSSQPEDEDSYDLEFHGYDPDAGEQGTPERPKHRGEVPSAASVEAKWLPPVGIQSMGNFTRLEKAKRPRRAAISRLAPTMPISDINWRTRSPPTPAKAAKSLSAWIGFDPMAVLRRWPRRPTSLRSVLTQHHVASTGRTMARARSHPIPAFSSPPTSRHRSPEPTA